MTKPKTLQSYKKDQIQAAIDHWHVELEEKDNTHFEKAKALKDAGVTPEKMAAFINGESSQAVIPVEEKVETKDVNDDGDVVVEDVGNVPTVKEEPAAPVKSEERTEFKGYSLGDLRSVADAFGTEYDEADSEDTLVAKLATDGVDENEWNELKALSQPDENEEEEPVKKAAVQESEPEEDEEFILIKMTRNNYSYEAYGYEFTREHPYALVTESDADKILENEEGFSIASPREVKEFL